MAILPTLLLVPPTMILALHAFSAVLPRRAADRCTFAARSLTAVLSLIVCAAYGTVASVVLRLVGYGGLSQWTVARAYQMCMRTAAGVEFRVGDSGRTEAGRRGGQEALLTRPAVFVGNHQTELDVLMLGAVMPKYCSVTAKRSLSYVPFLGWFMTLSKTVFIDRANRATARAAFDSTAKQMQRERHSVFIFPEGTRSYTEKPEMLPFKKGAFHLAVQAQVPIVPIVVANYAHVFNMRAKLFRSGVIDVSVLPPIPTKGLTTADVDGLCLRTRDAMQAELIRLAHLNSNSDAIDVDHAASAPPPLTQRREIEADANGARRRTAVKAEL